MIKASSFAEVRFTNPWGSTVDTVCVSIKVLLSDVWHPNWCYCRTRDFDPSKVRQASPTIAYGSSVTWNIPVSLNRPVINRRGNHTLLLCYNSFSLMNGNQIETIDEKAFHRVDINKLWVNNCRNARFCPRDENVRCCYLAQERLSNKFNHTASYLREAYNPFTPKSDQFQMSPKVLLDILHHRTKKVS